MILLLPCMQDLIVWDVWVVVVVSSSTERQRKERRAYITANELTPIRHNHGLHLTEYDRKAPSLLLDDSRSPPTASPARSYPNYIYLRGFTAYCPCCSETARDSTAHLVERDCLLISVARRCFNPGVAQGLRLASFVLEPAPH